MECVKEINEWIVVHVSRISGARECVCVCNDDKAIAGDTYKRWIRIKCTDV